MGITMTTTGRSGKPGRPSFFPIRAHLLTTGQRPAVISLSPVGPCALRGGLRSLRRAPDNAAAYPCRHCLCGWQTAYASFAPSLQTVVLFRDNLPPVCDKSAIGSFIAAMDDVFPAPSIFFCHAKRNKTAPCRGQKGRE